MFGHIRHDGLDADLRPQVYWHHRQRPRDRMALVVRASGATAPAAMARPVVAAIRAVDPEQPAYAIQPMRDLVARTLAQRQFNTAVLLAFAFASLARLGVFGVVSYSVAQRTREFGVRMALGAQSRDVLRLVLWRGAGLAGTGLALGLGGVLVAARGLETLLFEVHAIDVPTLIGASAILAFVALVSSYVPARRAVAADPLIALRSE